MKITASEMSNGSVDAAGVKHISPAAYFYL